MPPIDPEPLLAALSAHPDGLTVPELMAALGRCRPWVAMRLAQLRGQGAVTEVRERHNRGRWQASRIKILPPSHPLELNKGNNRLVGKKGNKALKGGRPVPPPASEEDTRRILALAALWANAVRYVVGKPYWRAPLRGPRPWEDPRQAWWWNSFVLLDRRLREWGADPRQFLAALMASRLGPQPGRGPNPRQMVGPTGKAIWTAWRALELEKWCGRENGARHEARLATETEEERLTRGIKEFYADVVTTDVMQGGAMAVSTLRPPEVLCAVYDTEPGLRPIVEVELREEAAAHPDSPWLVRWRQLRNSIPIRARLTQLRSWALGDNRARFPRGVTPWLKPITVARVAAGRELPANWRQPL